jgi:hypothetical protein
VRIVRYGLLAGAAIFGLLVVARAFFGPLSFPVPVRTPINIESFCAVCLMLALLIKVDRPAAAKPNRASLIGMAALGLLVAVGFWRAVGVYFLADDFILVTYYQGFHAASIRPMLTTGGGDGFFRPVGYLAIALTATWAKFDPRLWHITALVLHGLNSAIVFSLASRLGLSRWPAWFAGALFAIHGCLPESTVWIAGRFDLLCTFFVLSALLALLAHLQEERPRRWWYGAASIVLMVLALLSKEEAYIFPFLAALLVVSRRTPWRKAAAILSLFLVVASILFMYRWMLQGGIGGYTDLKSGAPLFGELGLVQTARILLLRLWAVLFFPINWSVQPGVALATISAAYVLALVLMVLMVGSRNSRLPLIFPLGTIILAALPPLHQLLIGVDLQKSRLLYLPLAGFSLLLATAVEPLGPRSRWIVPATILLFHFAALQHNLTLWQRAGEVAKRACTAAVQCALPKATKLSVWNMPGSLDGVYLLDLGFNECVKMQTPSSIPIAEFHNGDPAIAQEDTAQLVWDQINSGLSCERERTK